MLFKSSKLPRKSSKVPDDRACSNLQCLNLAQTARLSWRMTRRASGLSVKVRFSNGSVLCCRTWSVTRPKRRMVLSIANNMLATSLRRMCQVRCVDSYSAVVIVRRPRPSSLWSAQTASAGQHWTPRSTLKSRLSSTWRATLQHQARESS